MHKTHMHTAGGHPYVPVLPQSNDAACSRAVTLGMPLETLESDVRGMSVTILLFDGLITASPIPENDHIL